MKTRIYAEKRKRRFTQTVILVFCLWSFVFGLVGCESFRKKFIRKPKHQPEPEPMVITPKDYSQLQLPPAEAYQQYYTYWKAWHLELLNFLKDGESKKKIISCFEQTILNLGRMKDLLVDEEKIALLEKYSSELSKLEEEVDSQPLVMLSMARLKSQSEQLFRNIQRDFSFSKVKNDLKE